MDANGSPVHSFVGMESTHGTLGNRVYGALRGALTRGRFAPGQVLTIRALAAALNTSRMPVREALLRLGAEGALEVLDNGSVRMPVLSGARYFELTQVRILLEGEAAAQAAQHAAAADVRLSRRLSDVYDAAVRAGDQEAMLSGNLDFHFQIYRLARNDTLMHHIEQLWMQAGPYVARTLGLAAIAPGLKHSAYSEGGHRDLLKALAAADPKAAHAAIEKDIRSGLQLFEAFEHHLGDMFGSVLGTQRRPRTSVAGPEAKAHRHRTA